MMYVYIYIYISLKKCQGECQSRISGLRAMVKRTAMRPQPKVRVRQIRKSLCGLCICSPKLNGEHARRQCGTSTAWHLKSFAATARGPSRGRGANTKLLDLPGIIYGYGILMLRRKVWDTRGGRLSAPWSSRKAGRLSDPGSPRSREEAGPAGRDGQRALRQAQR